MEKISVLYRDSIVKMMGHARLGQKVTEDSVLQEANKAIQGYVDTMVSDHLAPESCMKGWENLAELNRLAKEGYSCLLLPEHYSNFDLPVILNLTRRFVPDGERAADDIIAIAGIKLNETNPVVTAFTEAFSRIVIAPSRSLRHLDPEKDREQILRCNAINRASIKVLNDAKKGGKLILVFPSGTRYRPWEPETKRGVREIDSYIKSFDYMCLVSLNGMILRMQEGRMEEDYVCKDTMLVEVSKPIACKDFRAAARAGISEDEDPKQAVADAIMAALEEMHQRNEAELL